MERAFVKRAPSPEGTARSAVCPVRVLRAPRGSSPGTPSPGLPGQVRRRTGGLRGGPGGEPRGARPTQLSTELRFAPRCAHVAAGALPPVLEVHACVRASGFLGY